MINPDAAAWFNKLPMIRHQREADRYERACPCGDSILYDCEDMHTHSWINLHYPHSFYIVEPKLSGGYNLGMPIKFNKAGFKMFAEQFNLKPIDRNSERKIEFRRVFSDGRGNLFVFYPNDDEVPVKNDYEGVYMTFDHLGSVINTI